jgi:putative Flp pilus-assembly TadE/G-like protein
MAAVLRREAGQMTPVIVFLLVGIVGMGVIAVQIGKATVLRSDAQTAADAAALAAARNIRTQLSEQVALTGTSSLANISDARVQAEAARYAALNEGRLSRDIERDGADVKVWVETERTQGDGAPKGQEDQRANARARARLELVPIFPGNAGGGGVGAAPAPSGGDPKISDDEWDQIKKELKHHPPQCSDNPDDNDVYILGQHLQKHGFVTLANAQLGSPPTPGKHDPNGWHYKCANSGAIDLNYDCCGQAAEDAAINPLVQPLHDLGFSTIWQAPGHTDHMHINGGGGASVGVGGTPGGAVGPLVDAYLDIHLIDWDAPAASAGGFDLGGLGSRIGPSDTSGPPDPKVAAVACELMHRYHLSGTARLALWEAMIVESGVHNPPDGMEDSVGVLQARAMHGSFETRMNPAWQIAKFIVDGYYHPPTGVIEAARMFPDKSAGWIAQYVQGSDYPNAYDLREADARADNEKFCGGEGL